MKVGRVVRLVGYSLAATVALWGVGIRYDQAEVEKGYDRERDGWVDNFHRVEIIRHWDSDGKEINPRVAKALLDSFAPNYASSGKSVSLRCRSSEVEVYLCDSPGSLSEGLVASIPSRSLESFKERLVNLEFNASSRPEDDNNNLRMRFRNTKYGTNFLSR